MPCKAYIFLLISFGFCISFFSAQTTFSTPDTLFASVSGLIAPLDIPLVLSGNFGEFRGDHFHTGLDFKTQGQEGFPVLAVANGVVSRVKVSPWGYGQALYLLHDDGSTSVYAHLSRYSSSIQEWLIGRQYSSRSFGIDARPVYSIRFEVGDTIGWSGNSGSSGGPHLHFEIRDENQHPVNPLKWDFKITDTRAPEVGNLVIIPVNSQGLELRNEIFTSSNGDTTEVKSGIIHLCVEAKDRLDGASNVCGIYKMEVTINGISFSSYSIDTLDFAVNKDMNAHSYYPRWSSSRTQIHRFRPLPGDRLPIYDFTSKSKLNISVGELIHVIIKCWDAHGNLTQTSYYLKGSDSVIFDTISGDIPGVSLPATYSTSVKINDGDVSVFWPKNSFYSREIASLHSLDDMTFYIGPDDAPLAKPFTLSVPCELISKSNKCDKWVVERLSKNGTRLGVETCKRSTNRLSFSSRKMGWYHFLQDTIAPRLLPKYSSSPLIKNGNLVFHIEDELSGVSKIEGFIDGEWVLFRWDPKKKTAAYFASDLSHITGISSKVTFKAWDGVLNKSVWTGFVVFP
ncbi:MAG: hypothetical protein COA49_06210 [Bacteroidetes bacterium]|nr:MAG: hypothetical protein COA49_06210 [Bacteroidota bacterium]